MPSPIAAVQPVRQPTSRPSDAILERLTRLHPKIIDLSLGRIERLLARLGHPERALPPVVHVAGTNGKGSVIACLRAMLEAAGRRVQVYSSPHLVRFNERIRLADGLIEEAVLAGLLEECEAANGHEPITFFEVTTAAAFLAFARDPADVLLLETGLGGRLDATNVVARPRLSVITSVSIDHVQYLGDSLEKIAFEKAGILKPGVPAVIGPQSPAVLAVIEQRAAALGTPLHRAGREWVLDQDADGFRLSWANDVQPYPRPTLVGRHQVENAALAVACARLLDGFGLDGSAIRNGLVRAEWPGRLQRLTRGPLAGLLPAAWELWLDGGHNEGAARALAQVIGEWDPRPLHLVFGMLSSKATQDFLRPIAPLARSIHAVTIPGEQASLSAAAATSQAAEAGFIAIPRASVAAALEAIAATGERPGRVLVCGSLYLAGRILADNG